MEKTFKIDVHFLPNEKVKIVLDHQIVEATVRGYYKNRNDRWVYIGTVEGRSKPVFFGTLEIVNNGNNLSTN